MVDRRRAVCALVGCSVAIFWPGAFIFGFPGVMAPYWKETFHLGQEALGHIMFFVLAGVGTFMFLVGRWQEKLGIRAMIAIGGVTTGLDVLFIAFASNIFMVYLWAFIVGAASCFIYAPSLTTVQRWFPARRGMVVGIVNFIFGVSAAILSPVFAYLLGSMGYVTMTATLGIFALMVGVAAAPFTGPPERGIEPTSDGLPRHPTALLETTRGLSVSQSIRTPSFWFLWLTWALQGAACISMVTLSTMYGLSKGYALESAVMILLAFNMASGFSRLAGGILSDLVGRNSIMSITFLAAGLAYLAMPRVEGLVWIAGLAVLIGFAFGTLVSVSAPLTVDCFGITHFGAILGLVFTAYGFVAGPLGPSLSGYILDSTQGNYPVVFWYLGSFCLISSVLIRFVRPPKEVH